MKRESITLSKWNFKLGEEISCLKDAKEVTIPHTWNVEDGSEEYWGTGWYEYKLEVPSEWKEKRVLLHFHSVYHDAVVFVNGTQVGEHRNSGYTPFDVELTGHLQYGTANRLAVQVNNEFSETMFPYKRSFDWANDGGIIREVEIQLVGEHYIKSLRVTAEPVILTDQGRQEEGEASLTLDVAVDGVHHDSLTLAWEVYEGCDEQLVKVYEQSTVCADGKASIKEDLKNIKFWHFDDPNLYTLRMKLLNGNEIEDQVETTFGFRDFHVKGNQFFLNGEAVRICGTEWMPGSDPAYGMAEPKEQLEKMLTILKESNCVFSRFHWQQDDIVYDWCDRHGMLIQEEVPYWGKEPAVAGEVQLAVLKQQMSEMIEAHYNHPCIIAWGVGNELAGQEDETVQYIKDAVAFTKSLDPHRTANYVSNTFIEDKKPEGTTFGDIMMINDYIGTWLPGDQHGVLKMMVRNTPDKPLVSSEFGLCEPSFAGGDARRIEIFLEKMTAYRQYPGMAGTINFCLNDYRTQIGEDSTGKLRRRIHGSTDLWGELKPSYDVVRRECAPFIIKRENHQRIIECRNDLPSYQMKGYWIEEINADGEVDRKLQIPDLCPGESWTFECKEDKEVTIFRKTGDCCGVIK